MCRNVDYYFVNASITGHAKYTMFSLPGSPAVYYFLKWHNMYSYSRQLQLILDDLGKLSFLQLSLWMSSNQVKPPYCPSDPSVSAITQNVAHHPYRWHARTQLKTQPATGSSTRGACQRLVELCVFYIKLQSYRSSKESPIGFMLLSTTKWRSLW